MVNRRPKYGDLLRYFKYPLILNKASCKKETIEQPYSSLILGLSEGQFYNSFQNIKDIRNFTLENYLQLSRYEIKFCLVIWQHLTCI